MEILAAATSDLKCKFAGMMQEQLMVNHYGIMPSKNIITQCDDIRLKIIFISNIKYLPLSQNQLDLIEAGDYAVCCK